MSLNILKREDFLYQSCYCEENIWHLCQNEQLNNSYVIFVASKGGFFPMLNQQAGNHLTIPIFWDYHVILLVLGEKNQIVDFDTTLPFCVDIDTYFSRSFIDNNLLAIEETPFFRALPSAEFIRLFSSDRSHMKTATGWSAAPPNWPLIGNMDSNLFEFIDMTNNNIGEVYNYDELLERFC